MSGPYRDEELARLQVENVELRKERDRLRERVAYLEHDDLVRYEHLGRILWRGVRYLMLCFCTGSVFLLALRWAWRLCKAIP